MVVKESKNLSQTLKKQGSRKCFCNGCCHFFSRGGMCAYFKVEWNEAVQWEPSNKRSEGITGYRREKGWRMGIKGEKRKLL